MAYITTNRRIFIVIVFICFISFAVYDWRIRREDVKKLNLMKLQNQVVNFNPFIQYLNNNILKLRESSENIAKLPISLHSEIENKNIMINADKSRYANPIEDVGIIKEFDSLNEAESSYQSNQSEHELTLADSVETTIIVAREYTKSHLNLILEKLNASEEPKHTTSDTDANSYPSFQMNANSRQIDDQKYALSDINYTTTNTNNLFKNVSLILDTSGCKIQKLDPWDPSVLEFLEGITGHPCPGPPLFMKSKPGGSVVLNATILGKYYDLKPSDISCHYQGIRRERVTEEFEEIGFSFLPRRNLVFGVPLNEDYIRVECQLRNQTFEQYLPLVRLKKDLEEKKNSIHEHVPGLNIILLGIDSVSKLNFLRHFSRTRAFIKEKLSSFEMNGYVKVGDNTFPNLVPLLTGHFVEYYWNETINNITYFDEIDLVWKHYANKGYRTFYAEDDAIVGTFNYEKRGFYEPPTDYYMRPLALAYETTINQTLRNNEIICLNSQTETDIIYNYLRDFVQAMDQRPYFAFAMVSSITHDSLNQAGYADEPTFHLLEDLWYNGALNNSLLVLFSDHGLRFGDIRKTYIGKMEERLPFMFINIPTWFLNQHPNFVNNLQDNQNRLVTLFDVHATIVHLLNLENRGKHEQEDSLALGSSLFNKISPSRTCSEANIPPHACPCQIFEAVSVNDTAAKSASIALVDNINRQLSPYRNVCALLTVNDILDARIGRVDEAVVGFVETMDFTNLKKLYGRRIKPIVDYLITLTTKPGNAVFETTVRHDPEHNSFNVSGISRINKYGKQSWCVDSPSMKLLCYCKTQNY